MRVRSLGQSFSMKLVGVLGKKILRWLCPVNPLSISLYNLSGNCYEATCLSWFKKLMCYYVFWRRQWQPTPVPLPGKSHGRRSLVGCSPWGRWGSDTTERLHFYFLLSCIGEGNGNPLQCSSLENPRDRGAWWAAVHGVAQSRTWLKWLSNNVYWDAFLRLTLCLLFF